MKPLSIERIYPVLLVYGQHSKVNNGNDDDDDDNGDDDVQVEVY